MPDKRSIDDLSIVELEQILAIKKREARQERLKRMKQNGRVIETGQPAPEPPRQPQQASSNPEGLPAATITAPKGSVKRRKTVPQFEDAIDRREYKKNDGRAGQIWHMFIDRSLLATEVFAVIGLVVLGIGLFNGVNILKEETAAAQAAADAQRRAGIPTLEPTPQLALSHIVLPSGHTPPQNGISTFNFAEVPPPLRNQMASQVFLPEDVARPPVTDDTPLRVNIPALSVDQTIVQGVDWNALQQGVGMLPNGALPRNASDNVVLAAHNDIYGEIFRHLDQLQEGDMLEVQTRSGVYTYTVRETLIVEPDDVHVMGNQGDAVVTLISCYPYQVNTQRIVVVAERIG